MDRSHHPGTAAMAVPAHSDNFAFLRLLAALMVLVSHQYELTGRPFSATLPRREHLWPTVTIGLAVPREVLDARIEQRVQRMWRDGLLDEVRRLETAGLREGRTASRAIGYAQALAQLDRDLTETEAQQQMASLVWCGNGRWGRAAAQGRKSAGITLRGAAAASIAQEQSPRRP